MRLEDNLNIVSYLVNFSIIIYLITTSLVNRTLNFSDAILTFLGLIFAITLNIIGVIAILKRKNRKSIIQPNL